MDEQQDEPQRRRFPRVNVSIPAKMSVLVPEDTFNPPANEALVVDLSERGMMVKVKVSEPTYAALLQRTRICRLHFDPSTGLPDRLVGKAVWIQPAGTGDQATLKLGLFFEEAPEATIEMLRKKVAEVAAEAPPTT